MRKMLRWAATGMAVVILLSFGGIMMDKMELQEKVLRLHVVGASDSDRDQALKLQVRDAVLERLEKELVGTTNKQQAIERVRGVTEDLAAVADLVLEEAGSDDRVTVSVEEVSFPQREYDTFRLPAGVYDALRITIGEGAGRNWWCVVFPELCVPAAADGVEAVAAGAGFSEGARGALTGKYEIRFYLLDLLGRMENFLRRRS